MNVKVKIDEKEKLRLEVANENQALVHLLAKTVTENGEDAAAIREHPFMTEPEILIIGSNPRKIIINASDKTIEKLEEFKDKFSAAMKK